MCRRVVLLESNVRSARLYAGLVPMVRTEDAVKVLQSAGQAKLNYYYLAYYTGNPYIYDMGIIFIETPEFADKFDSIAADEEMISLQQELMKNPYKGEIVKDTGGARKIRMGLRGKGKSGGARIIYYYIDLQGEIWLLDIYLKSIKADLSESDKKRLYKFIRRRYMANSNKYRVTSISKNGSRTVSHLSEDDLQKLRAKRLQKIRKEELGLTQKSFADAVGVNLRTLQDWEIGRSPMPKAVEILMELMREMPEVKEKLVEETR